MSVEPGSGSQPPRHKLGMIINHKQRPRLNRSIHFYIGFIFIVALTLNYFFFNYYSPHLDLLAPEEGEEDATPLGEEEAMRILEQQNDEEEQEKGETSKPGTSTDPDSGMDTAPPPPPPPRAKRPRAARIRAAGRPPPDSGLRSLHYQKRAASPSSHGSAKRTRTGSLSSCTSTRTSNFMPPLYYTTLNKRENAITPRVLGGGGGNPLVKGRFGTFTSDPRHTLATHRHIFDKGINISTSFDPHTFNCTSCTEHTHPVLQRGGGETVACRV